MHDYAYPLCLLIGGICFGIGLGYIGSAGNRATFKFAFKDGVVIATFGAILILIAWLFLRF